MTLAVPGIAQTGIEEHEQKISEMPAARQAYERYRFWSTPAQSERSGQSGDWEPKYRRHLLGRGFPADEIDAQIRLVKEHGAQSRIDRWNRILTAEKPRFNTDPNAFLVEVVRGLKPGKALDVGMGQGRNGIWLAQQGWDVTGFDPADKAVEFARTRAADLGVKFDAYVASDEKFDMGEERWDLILFSYAGG